MMCELDALASIVRSSRQAPTFFHFIIPSITPITPITRRKNNFPLATAEHLPAGLALRNKDAWESLLLSLIHI